MFPRLTQFFLKFPGIGPRQAKRFVFFLLSQSPTFIRGFIEELEKIKKETAVCDTCFRFFKKPHAGSKCQICSDASRDHSILLVVGTDIDYENIEKSGTYKGVYFILGDILPILEKDPEKKIRIKELLTHAEKQTKSGILKEIVLALSATPEGENTAFYVKGMLQLLVKKYPLKISELGRGLSTGIELEYSDQETIKNALQNRH